MSMTPKRCDECGGKLSLIPGMILTYGCPSCDSITWQREYARLLREKAREEEAREEEAVFVCQRCERPARCCECLLLCPICHEEDVGSHDCIPF